MALNKAQLKTSLIQILSNSKINSNVVSVANALANAIDAYVKTGNAVGTDTHGDGHNLKIQ